ncbi:MAG: polysaccharide deacetylase family protein [Betaproteobacteria bacterium]|nr:polysaccharide deacetylase family protein [Betaproteobacteria bacterium]
MVPSKRLPYSAIIDRAPLKLPRGVRLVVWPIVNVEVWDIGRPMPRQALPPPTGVTRLPDVPHWAWHEYGMRVGFWRLKAALDRLRITPTLSINARVCIDYPRIAQAARDSGWEFMGHSYDQRPIHLEPNQRATIRKAVKVIREYTGKRPVGWLGPGFTETLDTPEYLAEAGIKYIADWPADDEPCEVKTRKGPLLALPYSIELNDISMMIVQHHPAQEFFTRCMDHFDRLYLESRSRAKIMSIAVHPYISGTPYRIKYFERVLAALKEKPGVVFWTGEQIMKWYAASRRKRG